MSNYDDLKINKIRKATLRLYDNDNMISKLIDNIL